jgi:hypothetical protein
MKSSVMNIRLIDELQSIIFEHSSIGHVHSLWEEFGNIIIGNKPIESFGHPHNVKRSMLEILLIDWLGVDEGEETNVA